MKKILFVLCVLAAEIKFSFAQNIGINTDGTSAESGVMLDVKGINGKGGAPAVQTLFQVTSNEANNDRFKLRLILGTDGTANLRYAAIDAADIIGGLPTYRFLSFQPWGGNVGIGTTAPAVKAHIAGTNNGALELLRLDNLDANGRQSVIGFVNVGLGYPSTKIYGGGVDNGGSGTFKLTLTNPSGTEHTFIEATNGVGNDPKIMFSTTNGTSGERMRIDYLGNVGIGTTAPSVKLHVFSSADDQPEIQAENTNATGTLAAGVLRAAADAANIFMASHGSGRTLTRYGITLGGYSEITNWNGGNGLILGTTLAMPLIFGTSNLERMRVDANGYVGIGTTSPADYLNIVFNTNASKGILMRNQSSGAGAYTRMMMTNDASNEAGLLLGSTAAAGYAGANGLAVGTYVGGGKLQLYTVNAARVTVDVSGNVGINQTVPAAKLDVVGTSGTTLKIVDGNQGAGKVLTSDAAGVASWANGATTTGSGFVKLLYNDETTSSGTSTGASGKTYIVSGTYSQIKVEADIEADCQIGGAAPGWSYAIIYNGTTMRTAKITGPSAGVTWYSSSFSYSGAISNGQVISIDIPAKTGTNGATTWYVRNFRVYGIY